MDIKELVKLKNIAFKNYEIAKEQEMSDYQKGICYGQYILLYRLVKDEALRLKLDKFLGWENI